VGYIERKLYILTFGTIEGSHKASLKSAIIGSWKKRVDALREGWRVVDDVLWSIN
jgi:hypothetical protein